MTSCNDYLERRNKTKPKRKDIAYGVWLDKLITIATSIFEYDNLPPNLPAWELEARLIMDGVAVIFKTPDYGVMTSFGYAYGVDIYNHANRFGYAQPVIGSQSGLVNLVDGVIVYGSSIDKVARKGAVGRRIEYYADLLSDIDVSRQLLLITGRSTQTVIAKSDNALNELRAHINALVEGDLTVPKIESGVLDAVQNLFSDVRNNGVYTLQDLDLAQQNILKNFYTDFGIPYGYEKTERLITPEIAANNAMIDINIKDMLACRQEGVERVNSLYGTAITVKIGGDYFDII